jgi:hypothetical protein
VLNTVVLAVVLWSIRRDVQCAPRWVTPFAYLGVAYALREAFTLLLTWQLAHPESPDDYFMSGSHP